jgi:hypothetical protein
VLAAFVSMVRLAEVAIDECVGGNAHCAEDDFCLTSQVVLPLGWFGWNFFRRRRLVFNGGIASRSRKLRKLTNEKIS